MATGLRSDDGGLPRIGRYLNKCPPELRDLHLFSTMWGKWPAGHALQEAVAAKVARKAKVEQMEVSIKVARTQSVTYDQAGARGGASRKPNALRSRTAPRPADEGGTRSRRRAHSALQYPLQATNLLASLRTRSTRTYASGSPGASRCRTRTEPAGSPTLACV